MSKSLKENMYLIYKKPVTVNLSSSYDFINDKFGGECSTKLECDEYDALKEVYGEYDEENQEYVLEDKNDDYEGFEVGKLSYDGSISSCLVFKEEKANASVNSSIVNNMLTNTLTIFFDYEGLSSSKHLKMFYKDDEIYQKLFDFIDKQFTKLYKSRRYVLKIEGVYDKEDPNMLKWELSRIASIDFKHNSWTNWNEVSYSGFIKYENGELVMVESLNSNL